MSVIRSAFKKALTFIILIYSHLSIGAVAQPPLALQQWIMTQRQEYQIVGASIAVIKNYHIEWAMGFGYRDKNQKQFVTTKTLFNAASISKPITAFAVLETFTNKHLSLDENINHLLVSWHIPKSPYTEDHPVTIRLLLQHSAGITGWREQGYPQGTPLPTLVQELNGTPPSNTPPVTVVSQPGSQYLYSPAGYAIIQQVLMDLYQCPFADIMQQLVLQRMHMQNSFFAPPLLAKDKQLIAMAYLPDGKLMPNGPDMFTNAAAGGLWTTPTDLAKFIISLQKVLAGQSQDPSPQIVNIMLTPGMGHNMGAGMGINFNKYAQEVTEGNYFGHSGYNSGYLSLMLGGKTDGNGIVIMINSAPYMTEAQVPEYNFLLAVVKKIANDEHWQ